MRKNHFCFIPYAGKLESANKNKLVFFCRDPHFHHTACPASVDDSAAAGQHTAVSRAQIFHTGMLGSVGSSNKPLRGQFRGNS